MSVVEESPSGTVVGTVIASDPDAGDNAAVDFAIVDGDDDGVFDVIGAGGEGGADDVIGGGDSRTGVIVVKGRVDREKREEYLLTVRLEKKLQVTCKVLRLYSTWLFGFQIKCFRPYERNVKSVKKKFDNLVS